MCILYNDITIYKLSYLEKQELIDSIVLIRNKTQNYLNYHVIFSFNDLF